MLVRVPEEKGGNVKLTVRLLFLKMGGWRRRSRFLQRAELDGIIRVLQRFLWRLETFRDSREDEGW